MSRVLIFKFTSNFPNAVREICKLENLNEGLLIPNIPKKPCNSVLIIWKRNTLDAIRITLWKTRFIAFSKQFTPAHARYFKPRICTFLGVWIIATLFWVQQILARQKLKTLLRHLYTHKNFSDRMIFFCFCFCLCTFLMKLITATFESF